MPINYNEQVVLTKPSNVGYNTYHPCDITNTYGDWRLTEDDVERVLNLGDVVDFIIPENIKTVTLSEIAFKQNVDPAKRGVNCGCCSGIRYTKCNIKVPIIICEGGPNILGKAYRLLDGKHRIQKKIDNGTTDAKCFVIKYTDIKQHFKPFWRAYKTKRR